MMAANPKRRPWEDVLPANRRCYHEAGHAVVGYVLGYEARNIVNFECSPAFHFLGTEDDDRAPVASFAGYISERRKFPGERDVALENAWNDFWADAPWPPEAKAPFRQAHQIVRENWSAIERLASALDERDGNMPASHVVGFIENPHRPTIWERIVK